MFTQETQPSTPSPPSPPCCLGGSMVGDSGPWGTNTIPGWNPVGSGVAWELRNALGATDRRDAMHGPSGKHAY